MAGEEITIANLRSLLQIQTELRDLAEARWRTAQRGLLSLLETFVPEEIDRRLKAGSALDGLAVDELELLLRQTLGTRLQQVQGQEDVLGLREEIHKKNKEIESLRREVEKALAKLAEAQAENNRLANQLAALQQVREHIERQFQATVPTGSTPPAAAEPDWMEDWRRSETFERDALVVKIIGSTGLARRPLIEKEVARELGIQKPGGSLQTMLQRLMQRDLIRIDRPWEREGVSGSGRYPDLVRLTEKGSLAYWLLTGEQHHPDEFDQILSRHVTPEHTLLNLQAADILKEAGYHVNLTPPAIQLAGGGVFHPDLVIEDQDGRFYYVEVEREANKNRDQRQRKWLNFNQASGGQLYIICESRSLMRDIRNEINQILGITRASVYLTNLVDLQRGKRGEGDSIWLEVRQRK